MAPLDVRRPYKRPAISDQQRRRDVALHRQSQQRSDSQNRARTMASSILALGEQPVHDPNPDDAETNTSMEAAPYPEEPETGVMDVVSASKLRGAAARRWFAGQLMLPEWMVDIPPNLCPDWFVFPRPAGKRCFVVSSNGTTVSRLRNGSILHHFPSSLPNGARKRGISGPANTYCILDCIFHELDQTYYVIDMVCWRGYSLYDCTADFRLSFWVRSKLEESGACNPPSVYHKYRFSVVPFYDCDTKGLQEAYLGVVPYTKDGLLFYNKHAHYQIGNTPLALVWKDDFCSEYVLDTDSTGQIPVLQQVVLELQADGKVSTSDDPPVIFGCLDGELIHKEGLRPGNFLRFAVRDEDVKLVNGKLEIVDTQYVAFAVRDEDVKLVNGKLEIVDTQYVGKANRARAFADSYSKVLFQYAARHSPLRIDDLVASIQQGSNQNSEAADVEMDG